MGNRAAADIMQYGSDIIMHSEGANDVDEYDEKSDVAMCVPQGQWTTDLGCPLTRKAA